MDKIKGYLITGIICFAIGAGLSLLKKPEVQYKEKIVIQKVKDTTKDTKRNTVIEEEETKLPDGSVVKKKKTTNLDEIKQASHEAEKIDKQIDYSSKVDYGHRIELYIKLDKQIKPVPELSYTYQRGYLFIRGKVDRDINLQGDIGIKAEF